MIGELARRRASTARSTSRPKNPSELERRGDFEWLERAFARLIVAAPAAELRGVAKSSSPHASIAVHAFAERS